MRARWLLLVTCLVACNTGTDPNIVLDVGSDLGGVETIDGQGEVCTPACQDKECGPDGCGGECGSCSDDAVCEAGLCVPVSCENTLDCPGTLVCDEETGTCVECVGNEDCPDELICNEANQCVEEHPCESDLDCKEFEQLCDKDAGLCVDCMDEGDCLDEEFCLDGLCFPDACEADAVDCDGQDARICAGDGSGWLVTETCGEGWYCEEGECLEYACEPDSSWCDDQVYKLCANDGLAILEETDCEAAELFCTVEGCLDTICPPGETYCQDDVIVVTCSEDGQEVTTEICPEGEYCEDAACVEQVCEPFDPICADNVATVCNAIGSGPMVGGEVCTPGESVCIDGACNVCEVDCAGKECGDDSCGGTCGSCDEGICGDGACVECWDGNDIDWDGCNNGEMAEWSVNEVQQNNQYPSSLVGLSTGGFAIVWTSMNEDGDGDGVYARLYGALGQPQWDAFQVNTWTTGIQSFGRAAPLPGGGFAVVWRSDGQDPDGSTGVYGQVVGPDGSKDGLEQHINQTVEGDQTYPDIACTLNGRCLVVWELDGSGGDVIGQWFEPGFVKSGGEFLLSYFSTGEQEYPRVSPTPDGTMILVWGGSGPGDDEGVFVRRIDPDGEFLGAETLVNTITADGQFGARVGALPDGSSLVSWSSDGVDGSGRGVAAQAFSSAGEPIGPQFLVNESTDDDQLVGAVVGLDADTYFVVWQDQNLKDIFGRLVTSSGTVVGSEFKLNVYSDDAQSVPRGTGLLNGGAVVAWATEDQFVGGRDVVAQIFSADGEKVAPVP